MAIMYLIDANIILEILLQQERNEEAKKFLESKSPLYITDFSLHSIGILLLRQKMHDIFLQLVKDMRDRGIHLIQLNLEDMPTVVETSQEFVLDFDDAYQYGVAEKYNLTIVSFDSHFDQTTRGRKTPAQLIG